jgi:hypothetical protein
LSIVTHAFMPWYLHHPSHWLYLQPFVLYPTP